MNRKFKYLQNLLIYCSLTTMASEHAASQTAIPMFEKSELVWIERDGREEMLPIPPQNFGSLELSPDGEYLATFITEDGIRDLWTYHFSSGEFVQITNNGKAGFPTWTPDGDHLIYASWGEGLWQVRADGRGSPIKLTEPTNSTHAPNTFSPDGQLVYVDIVGSDIDLHLMSIEEPQSSMPLLKTDFHELAAAVSPNGRWIAYTSGSSGQWEIHVSDFPNMERSWQITKNGGQDPRWSKDGNELYFETSASIFSVLVNTGSEFEHGIPKELIQGNYHYLPLRSYDVSQEGDRILMSKLNPQ